MTHNMEMRCSNAERDKVRGILNDALADGRLDIAEFDERVRKTYAAERRADLIPLVGDLSATPQVDIFGGPGPQAFQQRNAYTQAPHAAMPQANPYAAPNYAVPATNQYGAALAPAPVRERKTAFWKWILTGFGLFLAFGAFLTAVDPGPWTELFGIVGFGLPSVWFMLQEKKAKNLAPGEPLPNRRWAIITAISVICLILWVY